MNIKDSAKTILCYGDSNTWGTVPKSTRRYPRSIRWPSVLQNLLGVNYEVISEGLPGRTLVAVDPEAPHLSGIACLPVILKSCDPIDLIIIMLGTNDVRLKYDSTAEDIAKDLEQTVNLIQSKNLHLGHVPGILIICPPTPLVLKSNATEKKRTLNAKTFKNLPHFFEAVANKYGCAYLNAGEYIRSGRLDGLHLGPEAHLKLAEMVKVVIEKLPL